MSALSITQSACYGDYHLTFG